MGVVYKARDTRLDRFVALKVLPAGKVANPDRKRRFVQEAKAASALNHPHIITIYDIDQAEGLDFIAMEFVPGKTLDQLIPRKGMRLNEALKYAIQIADALAAAHAAGIVHRDLKPGNVMVNDNGQVKVLDFGLAKLTEQGGTTEFDRTETIADRPETEEGVILGTVSYMSPEQAEGRKVDARSDVFSFGALLYEMLTGRRAFHGDSKMSTLAAILNREPEPVEGIPHEVSRIVQRCLRKELDRRAHSMVDLKLALEEVKEESDSGKLAGTPQVATKKNRKTMWVGTTIVLLALSGAAYWLSRTNRAPQAALQAVPLTTYPGAESYSSFSPDGNQVAFHWNGEKEDNSDIYVKLIGSGRPLRLTTDPALDLAPAWSPDGRSIAFVRHHGDGRSEIQLISPLGGSERQVAAFPNGAAPNLSPAWSQDGRWLVISARESARKPRALSMISIETGEKRQVTFPPADANDAYGMLSPDGGSMAFVRSTASFAGDLYVVSLKVKGEPKRLTSENRTIYGMALTGDGSEIVFSSNRGGLQGLWRIAVSGSGQPQRLAIGENGYYPVISRQGNRLVYSQSLTDSNIWRLNLADPREAPAPLISSTRDEREAHYSPDGKKIAFASDRSGNTEVWVCDADGSNPVQLVSLGWSSSSSWSRDSQRIAFDSNVDGHWQIYTVSSHGGRPQRMTQGPANDTRPSWSRDGKWIYFSSDRTGASQPQQIWKIPVGGGDAVQVSTKGGYNPVDSDDGKTIYYTTNNTLSPLWKVPLDGGEPTQLVPSIRFWNFAVARGGIYFIAEPELRYFSFAAGTSKPILKLPKPAHIGLSVSPDEHWLLYVQVDQSGSDLMLVENFR